LEVKNLVTHYFLGKEAVSAVEDVSFTIEQGETLGLAGESGCGKTTTAYSIMRLLAENGQIMSGQILLDGDDLVQKTEREMRKIRWRDVSIVFQYAMNAFNPVIKIGKQIIEIIRDKEDVSKAVAEERVKALFEEVGLEPKRIYDYPHEFSGGMRQRAIIAQALALEPKLIIADEPVTALDVIVQNKILELLKELQERYKLGVLLITHDLSVVAENSDKVGIMYAGMLVETGTGPEVFKETLHPYTYKLIGAFPSVSGPKHRLEFIPGTPPNLLNPPSGCRFHPRCPWAQAICLKEVPEFRDLDKGHFAACHFAGELNFEEAPK
ncbi:MAG: ABC transporter ATP-binding protein, partial [Candidatus Hermodarchaeota archaeon]|nr:ABC transporter ATP-binding protein [Candidatus Hermodarchaeota archaeon]